MYPQLSDDFKGNHDCFSLSRISCHSNWVPLKFSETLLLSRDKILFPSTWVWDGLRDTLLNEICQKWWHVPKHCSFCLGEGSFSLVPSLDQITCFVEISFKNIQAAYGKAHMLRSWVLQSTIMRMSLYGGGPSTSGGLEDWRPKWQLFFCKLMRHPESEPLS